MIRMTPDFNEVCAPIFDKYFAELPPPQKPLTPKERYNAYQYALCNNNQRKGVCLHLDDWQTNNEHEGGLWSINFPEWYEQKPEIALDVYGIHWWPLSDRHSRHSALLRAIKLLTDKHPELWYALDNE